MTRKKTETADAPKAPKRAPRAKPPVEEPLPVEQTIAPPDIEPADDAVSAMDVERIIVFTMDSQRYALPIGVVQEIQQIVELSELPDASRSVVGVINLRGQVVPAVDLRRLVGVPDRPYDLQTPMIFCRTGHGLVALIVDQVEDVVDVPPTALQEPSRVYALADLLIAVCRLDDGMVFLFDIDALIPADADAGGA